MIIDGRQRPVVRLIEWLLTLTGWAVLLFFFVQILLLSRGVELNVAWNFLWIDRYMLQVVLWTAGLTLLLSGGLWAWGDYNKRRYGHLRRRSFPDPVSPEELADFFGVPAAQVRSMQQSPWADLKHGVEG